VLRESRRSDSFGCRNFFQRSLFAMRTFLCAFYYKAKSAFRTSLFRLFRFVRPHEYTFFVISGRDPLRWVFARVARHMLGKTVPGGQPVFQMVPGMKSEGRNGRMILPELEKSRIGISCDSQTGSQGRVRVIVLLYADEPSYFLHEL
jgi:hypothetical protein